MCINHGYNYSLFVKCSIYSVRLQLYSENRYLLFLTENYAALDILKHYLGREVIGSDLASQPYILFGSNFPRDKEYTQVSEFTYWHALDTYLYELEISPYF